MTIKETSFTPLTGTRVYIGTKVSNAKPMTRQEYNTFRGWTLPSDENGDDLGYIVQYKDGYISWSPAKQFEEAYRPMLGLSFGLALEALHKGYRIAREGWNGKSMFLFLVPGSTFKVNRPPLLGIYPEGTVINYHAHIDMKTATGEIVPWLASQTDVLAEDWSIV